jgi:hypothetical protein
MAMQGGLGLVPRAGVWPSANSEAWRWEHPQRRLFPEERDGALRRVSPYSIRGCAIP